MCISLNKTITVWWCQIKKLILPIHVLDLFSFYTMDQQFKTVNLNES